MKNNNTFYFNPKQAVLPMLIQASADVLDLLRLKWMRFWQQQVCQIKQISVDFNKESGLSRFDIRAKDRKNRRAMILTVKKQAAWTRWMQRAMKP